MRVIHYSNHDGTIEGVYFTEELDMNAEDVLPPNCQVDNDFEVDDEFPSTFPLGFNLERNL